VSKRWATVAALALVIVYNPVGNEALTAWAYVPVNVAVGAVLLALARRSGLSWDLMGLRTDRLAKGAKVGLAAAAVIAGIVAVAILLAPVREYFADDRFIGQGWGEMLYQTLVRIPIGTAAFEEVVFRGVLLGFFLQRMAVWRAATLSSVLFGLWHILPTFDSIETNPGGDLLEGGLAVMAAVVGSVIVTGLAGYGFTWLRLRANSLLAPIVAHFAINSVAYAAGWMVVRYGWA
jgi:membrane protease YdiL (CAAX protease family)